MKLVLDRWPEGKLANNAGVSGDMRVPKCRLIVAVMFDLQNLRALGRGCSFYSPQSSYAFKIQELTGYSVHSPKKYA